MSANRLRGEISPFIRGILNGAAIPEENLKAIKIDGTKYSYLKRNREIHEAGAFSLHWVVEQTSEDDPTLKHSGYVNCSLCAEKGNPRIFKARSGGEELKKSTVESHVKNWHKNEVS